jgi:hypothetical protein
MMRSVTIGVQAVGLPPFRLFSATASATPARRRRCGSTRNSALRRCRTRGARDEAVGQPFTGLAVDETRLVQRPFGGVAALLLVCVARQLVQQRGVRALARASPVEAVDAAHETQGGLVLKVGAHRGRVQPHDADQLGDRDVGPIGVETAGVVKSLRAREENRLLTCSLRAIRP